MNTKYELKMPRTVYGGEASLSRIKYILMENKAERLAVFTDKGIEKAGLLELVVGYIKHTGAAYRIFDELPAEPSYMEAQALVDECYQYQADLILAVGGGSVMDTAKLASVLMTKQYGIKDLLEAPLLARKCLKTIMIPTTAGTGAEATPNAIIAVPERQLKVGIVNPEMMADYVILDARMVKALPKRIVAATGMDALAHAIECWTSKKANMFSDIYSLQALKMILNNLETAYDEPDNLEAKNQMLIASFYAGVAITASGTTAVHALSYPLGGRYHIAHGVSNAILLTPVMKFNEEACLERLSKAYDFCIRGSLKEIKAKSHALIERIAEIATHLDIPKNLMELGVPKEDLESLVAAGMQVTRLLANNMRTVTEADARKIYCEIM